MAHSRLIVLGGASLTMARPNRHDLAVMGEIMDEIEQIILAEYFLVDAPFRWIGLIIRYGLKNDDAPICYRVNKRHGDLPLAIEIDVRETQRVSHDELKRLFMIATLKSLVHVARRYNLPGARFEQMLAELQTGPV